MGDPYQNEEGTRIYLKVSDFSFNEARHEAAQFAVQIGDDWSRTRYLGKQNVGLHDHDGWEDCTECPHVPTWTFEHYEGTYRG